MTEKEYLAVSNLQRARAASAILRNMTPDERVSKALFLLGQVEDEFNEAVVQYLDEE